MVTKHQSHSYPAIIAATVLLMVLGCGLPENFNEAIRYYDDSTGTVTILQNYEAKLRCLANKAADGNIPDGWQQEVGRIKAELEKQIATEKQSMGERNEKLKMKYEMLNWLEALRAACEEGLKPAPSPEKTAVGMYRYLDLAGEMGRIVRSDREMLAGHYRSLH
jgi:hypothetical protein